MTGIKDRIQWQTQAGQPIEAGGYTIIPVTRMLIIHGSKGGWVWNQPAAIRVKDAEGERHIPIIDVTRIAQLLLIGLGLIFSLVSIRLSKKTSATTAQESQS